MVIKAPLLYAPNVNTGGGLVLLQAFMNAWPDEHCLVAWLDIRAKAKLRLPLNSDIIWVRPSISSRLFAEFSLSKKSNKKDRVLCFHGLPPLLRSRSELFIFQQNRNILGLVPLHSFALWTRQRLRFEQAVAWLFRNRCQCYWVQTSSMARELQKWYGERVVDIRILPFMENKPQILDRKSVNWDFIYVADGEAHKNHRRLVEAWVILARLGLKPSLALTLSSRDTALSTWVQQLVDAYDLKISNLGELPHEKALELYVGAKALIFPSISESFGLPLIEASKVDLPILAGELDFVRDVCEPLHTFDPYSSVSIARAVRRFIGHAELPVRPVSAADFINAVMTES